MSTQDKEPGKATTKIMTPLPWQQSVWDQLSDRIDQHRLAHALIFTGLEGIGKKHLATALAQRLLCQAEMNKYACGSCKSCQLMAVGNHPDLTFLEPEERGKAILIDPVRKLCDFLTKTSQQGGWKVAVISPAESMNINAANALLKSLEEPQGQTLLILVSHRPGRVAATIRSRCQNVNLPLPEQATAQTWLNEITGQREAVAEVLELAGRRPLLALDYIQSDTLELRRDFEALVDKLRMGEINALDAAQQCQKLDADQALDWFMSYLHRLVSGELKNRLQPRFFAFSDKLNKAREWVLSGTNPNPQLLWEELFMNWVMLFKQR